MATSSEILDAAGNGDLRDRLGALRPDHVTAQQVWDNMGRLVRADVGDGASIASVFRYGLGQVGLTAGGRAEYVTDAHLSTALAAVFGAAPEPATEA